MLRFLFFVGLMVNVVVAGYLYLNATHAKPQLPEQVNRDALQILNVVDAAQAQEEAQMMKKLLANLAGAACLEFGVKPSLGGRAQAIFIGMRLAELPVMRNIEEFTRYGVMIVAIKDRRTADTLLFGLKRAGVTDVSIQADNTISLGVFSSEEAARRYLSELETRAAALVKGAIVVPKNAQVKETVFLFKAPDPNLMTRLAVMQRDFEGSTLLPVPCLTTPAAAPAVVAAPTTP